MKVVSVIGMGFLYGLALLSFAAMCFGCVPRSACMKYGADMEALGKQEGSMKEFSCVVDRMECRDKLNQCEGLRQLCEEDQVQIHDACQKKGASK